MGRAFPLGESSCFRSSSLCTSVPFLALWTDQDLCAGRKNQGTGRVREEAHMHSSDVNPVPVISSLILADRSEILHRLKLVNSRDILSL